MKQDLIFHLPCKTHGWLRKTAKVIQLAVFLFTLTSVNLLAAESYPQNARLSLNLKSVTIEQVLQKIEHGSEFFFLYNSRLVDVTRKVDVSYKEEKILDILEDLFAKDNVEYVIKDRQIILSPKDYDKLFSVTSKAQGITVTGKVTDSNGNTLPGVNVVENGTINGAITDIDGNYSITVSGAEATLQFSSVGYLSEEIIVGSSSTINIILIEDILKLDEVVVVGYGTAKKSDVTGSLVSVSEEQIREMPVTNVYQALQGRAAGVDVVNLGYGLNARPQIRIRGNRSLTANNDPLYVVDGIPIDGTLADFNPNDIESIEILKDASATAIYGSRGAAGVILLTTKRGKAGQSKINLDATWTIKNPLRFYDDLSGHEWMEIGRNSQRPLRYRTPYPTPVADLALIDKMPYECKESVRMGYEWNEDGTVKMRPVTDEERAKWSQVMSAVPDEVPLYNPENVRDYDWFGAGRNVNALTQNYQFSVSGGTERVSTYFSLGYINEEGMGVGEKYQRISPRLNLDFQVTDWLKVGISNTFNAEITDPGEGLLTGVRNMVPISMPYDTSGEFMINPTADTQVKNPLRDNKLNSRENRASRYLGGYYAEVSFLKDFKYRLNVGQDFRHLREGRYRHALSSAIYPSVNDAQYIQSQDFHYTIDNLLYYNKQLGQHGFGVTLLQSIEAKRHERTTMYGQNYPYDSQLWYNMVSTNDPATLNLTSEYYRRQLASFMGRLNYNLMDKYLLTASLRYDGSSVFYVDNQWDYFPSFSVAWKVHNEEFLKKVDFLNQLKLRLGYGTVGNQTVKPYETSGAIRSTQYVFGETAAKGFAPDLIQTREVGWEKSATLNLGVDYGFFGNRIAGSIDIYRTNTYDLLLNKTLPTVTGYTKIRANVGETRNQGIEISLTSFNVVKGNFRWETDFNFAMNKEEIVKLAEGAGDDINSGWFIGYPKNSYRAYEYDGIWQVKDSAMIAFYNKTGNNDFKPGKIRVKDVDGNDTIDFNDETVVGHQVPKFSGGLTNRLYFKGFELSFFLYFRVGHGIYSRDGHYFPMDPRYSTPFLSNYYLPMGTEEENAAADHPAPATTRDKYESAMWFRKASFLKLRHITLAYNIPNSVISKVHIKSLKVSVQVYNPILITDYPYLDPEAQSGDKNNIPSGVSDKGCTFSLKVGF
ncbi:MAG: TonB-dependent receptor [Bacteroidales bacterium]